jgi:hypothetical protein
MVPIQARKDILLNVLILASMNASMAAMAVNTALQVPCWDTAFRAIEVLIMPDPATKIQPCHKLARTS